MTLIRDLKELEVFARKFIRENPRGGVFALEGDLGAGKTTFVRQVIASMSESNHVRMPRVVSPTFVLHQRYDVGHGKMVDHFDLYRLNAVDSDAAIEIGLVEAIQVNQSGFVFIEWSSKLTADSEVRFSRRLNIQINSDNSRTIT